MGEHRDSLKVRVALCVRERETKGISALSKLGQDSIGKEQGRETRDGT